MHKFILCLFLFTNLVFAGDGCIAHKLGFRKIESFEDVESFFPKSIEEVEFRKNEMISGIKEIVEKICLEEAPNFDNTARLLDLLFGTMIYGKESFSAISYLYTDKEIRLISEKAATEIEKVFYQQVNTHPKLYEAICAIPLEDLSEEHVYFVNRIRKQLKKMGLGLPQDKIDNVQRLQEEITDLSESFGRNIRESRRSFLVSLEELKGMDDTFIQGLSKKEDLYELTTDYPIVGPILSFCSIESTRKRMFQMFNNRADSQNRDILIALSAKRSELAHILGYGSYAEMQLETEMVKTPENAKDFLDKVENLLKEKQLEDFSFLKMHKPPEITLSEKGKFNPWDINYVITKVRAQKYSIDTEAFKVYFPLDYTLKGLMNIYETFFNIVIEEVPSKDLWYEDVRLLCVSSKNKETVYGYITLDLFPREGKYTHACDIPLLPSLKSRRGEYPALSAVVCNFPSPTKELPSLLRVVNLITFFHEFGHALHDMLGVTDLASTAGTNTNYDFVEMPSQILEEWLKDPFILQMCTSHYLTGEKLPIETIEKIIAYTNSFQASMVMKQLVFANFSLLFHQDPQADLKSLWTELKSQYCIETDPLPNDNFYLAFGHITSYGARYYGYLWSKVFALDVFEKIKKEGLLNPETGKKYIQDIIGRGGSLDPNQYLLDFLERKPEINAFTKSIK